MNAGVMTAGRSVSPAAVEQMMARLVADASSSMRLHDVAPPSAWRRSIGADHGHLLVAAALAGAVSALRQLSIETADLERRWELRRMGAVTIDDLATATRWLVEALPRRARRDNEIGMVTDTMAAKGWLTDPARVTSLIISIFLVAQHAGRRRSA